MKIKLSDILMISEVQVISCHGILLAGYIIFSINFNQVELDQNVSFHGLIYYFIISRH